MADRFQFEGNAWVFGDNLALDGELMDLRFALMRETDPEVLRHHIFAGIDPGLAARIKPGDLIVTGRRFAHGNPHIQGLIGLAGAGVGLLCESIHSGSYRCAINAGLPFLPKCPGLTQGVTAGDRLRADIRAGTVTNLNSGQTWQFEPLESQLLRIIEAGGWMPMFRNRLKRANAG